MVQVVLSSPDVQDLGDVTCAFGESRVAAQVVNSTLHRAVSLRWSHQTWKQSHPPPLIDGVPPDAIPDSDYRVSMDGIHFTQVGCSLPTSTSIAWERLHPPQSVAQGTAEHLCDCRCAHHR